MRRPRRGFAFLGTGRRFFDEKGCPDINDRLRTRLASWLDIPEEALGAPRVVLSGTSEARIENPGAILEYTPRTLRVRTAAGPVAVLGEDLVIRAYTRAALQVAGRLTAVQLGTPAEQTPDGGRDAADSDNKGTGPRRAAPDGGYTR